MTIVIRDNLVGEYNEMQRNVMSLISKAREKLNYKDYNFALGLIRQATGELDKYEERHVLLGYKGKRQSPTYGLRKSINKMERNLR